MDLKESSQMTLAQEMTHWWIRTRFLYIERALRDLPPNSRVLEVGCGTGQNLVYLRKESPLSKQIDSLVGFEPALPHSPPQSSELAPTDRLRTTLPELTSSPHFDALIATDVLEHLDDDIREMRHWMALLRPGARVLITVPAFEFLWSHHDELLGHRRRYTLTSLRHFARLSGLKEIDIHYAFGPLFPVVFLVRVVVGKLLKGKRSTTTDLKLPSPWINRLLSWICEREFKRGGSRFWGTSVVGTFEKPC